MTPPNIASPPKTTRGREIPPECEGFLASREGQVAPIPAAPVVDIDGTYRHEPGTTVSLCAGTTVATEPFCVTTPELKLLFDASINSALNTWDLRLHNDAINNLGFGEVTLTAIAIDAAGNPAFSTSHIITVVIPNDPFGPTAISAAAVADGTSIAVTVNEPLVLTGLDGSEFTLSGGTARSVTAVSTAGTTLTLTLSSPIQPGERVTLAYAPGVGSIADVLGNLMNNFTGLLVSTSTIVVLEVTAENRVYKAGGSVPITITFSDVVTVTGTPQLALNTGNGDGSGTANYTSGSGTTSLIFTYIVRIGDNIGDLAYTGSGALTRNGGSILGATPVSMALPPPGDANSLSGSSNVVLDNTPPAAPTFDAVGGLGGALVTERSNRLNAADLANRFSGGVPWGGSVDAGATVALCLVGAGDGTGASCGEGRTHRATTTIGTMWIYTLTLADLAAMGEGAETVTAIATDVVGNVSGEGSYDLIIDTTAPVFISGDSSAVAVGSAITVIAYDANATDNGGVADAGITYRLGAATFADLSFAATGLAFDKATGVVTYREIQRAAAAHNIIITATDLAGNTATQAVTISVVDGTITLTITDDVSTESGVANIAGGDVTFSFIFSEDVTGFDKGDITVAGGAKGAFTGTDPGRSYTLVVTPTTNTASDTITVTVDAGLATSQTTPSVTNVETIATRVYDTLAPATPGIVATVAGDNRINIADRDAGVMVSGTNEDGVGVTLCVGATPATDPTCAGGIRHTTATATTTWSYTLTAEDISTIGDRSVTLTAIAADVAGNTAVSPGITVTVDTVAPVVPAIDDPVTAGNIVNIVERDAGVIVRGTNEAGVPVTLCVGATDADCTGGTRYTTVVTGTTWSYTLVATNFNDDIAQGSVTLTAIAVDAAGNTAVSTGLEITVDTTAPAFSSGVIGGVLIGSSSVETVYNANVIDNGQAVDFGVTYTLGGDDAGLFSINSVGSVRYREMQNAEVTHRIDITATDRVGNSATQEVSIFVLPTPMVTITDSFGGEYANGNTILTYTVTFREDVTGFTADDIMIATDSSGATVNMDEFTEVTTGSVYTFRTQITAGGSNANDFTVTVTVPANAVTGMLTKAGNIEATASQKYDSIDPVSNALASVPLMFALGETITEVYNAEFTDGGGAADEGITYRLANTITDETNPAFKDDASLFEINSASGSVTFRNSPIERTYDIAIVGEDKAGLVSRTNLNIHVVTVPTITSVAAPDGYYKAGVSVPVTVTFSNAVTVDISGGIPQLALATGNGGGDGTADYASGSGTTALVFTYNVLPGDNINDLAYTGTTALDLNSGTIQSVADDIPATLTLPMVGTGNSLSDSSAVVLDTTVPMFTTASAADNRVPVTAAIDANTATEIYNAAATDRGDDTGITYALTGTDALTFAIDPNSGALTPAVTVTVPRHGRYGLADLHLHP